MFLAISSLYNTLTSKLLKTFTVDRGKEFAYYEQIENEFRIPMLPIPMQHSNVALMKIVMVYLESFFLKKTDLAKVTLYKLTEVLMLVNTRPKKFLEFKTPFDIQKHKIEKLI